MNRNYDPKPERALKQGPGWNTGAINTYPGSKKNGLGAYNMTRGARRSGSSGQRTSRHTKGY